MIDRSGREQLSERFMAEASVLAKENGWSLGQALVEVTRRRSDVWQAYSEAVVGHPAKPRDSARVILMAEVNAYASESNCSFRDALVEVAKRRPDLWQAYSEQVMGLK